MNFTVYELKEWDKLSYFKSGQSVEDYMIKWMIGGFEEDIFVAEGKEDEGYFFMKKDKKEEGVLVVVEDSKEYENYIRVMIAYKHMKEKEEMKNQNEYLN